MEERLLRFLRCPRCHASLNFEGESLACSGCQQIYAFYRNIPQLLNRAKIRDDWERYFNNQVREKGDTIAANSYLNQGHFRRLQQAMLELVGEIKDMFIADVGCGTGHFTESLAPLNFLLGLDLSLEMLQAAEAKGFFPIQASATQLPLADNSFDLVLANSIIQCLPDARKFLTELVRVCLPSGRIIISAFNSQNIFSRFFQYLEITKRPPLFLHSLSKIINILAEKGAPATKVCLLFYPSKIKKWIINHRLIRPGLLYLASSYVLEARKMVC